MPERRSRLRQAEVEIREDDATQPESILMVHLPFYAAGASPAVYGPSQHLGDGSRRLVADGWGCLSKDAHSVPDLPVQNVLLHRDCILDGEQFPDLPGAKAGSKGGENE